MRDNHPFVPGARGLMISRVSGLEIDFVCSSDSCATANRTADTATSVPPGTYVACMFVWWPLVDQVCLFSVGEALRSNFHAAAWAITNISMATKRGHLLGTCRAHTVQDCSAHPGCSFAFSIITTWGHGTWRCPRAGDEWSWGDRSCWWCGVPRWWCSIPVHLCMSIYWWTAATLFHCM